MVEPAQVRRPLLLDSHAFLWAMEDSNQLGPNVRAALASGCETWLSSATVWELGIKCALGRLTLPSPLRDVVRRAVSDRRLRVLDVTPEHALRAAELPHHHKDPFDRLLIAQAQSANLVLATRDMSVTKYDVPTLW
jgi:PIN domain nuclease of toxin-antitoxin system